jgi:hypothetical protein
VLGGVFRAPAAVDDLDPTWLVRGVVDAGDFSRLHIALAKASRGEAITIAAIGGSITAGAAASAEENRWPSRAAAWWRAEFPHTELRFLNAGIGATGSDIGAHRIRHDVLAARPDVVMVEFAVNDSGSARAGETLEGLLRQILALPNCPAVVMLFTMDNQGHDRQQEHTEVGMHYRVPMVSLRDALWSDVASGKVPWDDIESEDWGGGYTPFAILDEKAADSPGNAFEIHAIYSAGLPHAPMPWTRPLIRGTLRWLTPADPEIWTRTRLAEAIDAQQAAGFDLLWIVNAPQLLEQAPSILDTLYTLADARDLKVIVDLPRGGWYGETAAEMHGQTLAEWAARCAARYGSHRSFYGWYLNHEINWGYFPYMDPHPLPGNERPGQEEAYEAYRAYRQRAARSQE